MIEFRDLTLARGGRPLITGLTLQIHPGQKVGLTGANGCGKSTLLAALRGELGPEQGSCTRPANWVVAHVAQETQAVEVSALEWTLAGDPVLARVRQALHEAELNDDGLEVARLHEQLAACDGYRAEARGATLLHGLGFSAEELARPVREFSGGWRMRLELARALMCPSDLLLLDEPTNHLDLDAIVWLERWLAEYRGTLLMISHDRDFLDATVEAIAHIEDSQLRLYRGGYSDFERIRAERLMAQQSQHAAEQRAIARLKSFVDRFRAKASKARQAQSRIKALERMELTAAVQARSTLQLVFPEPLRNPDQLLQLTEADLGYGSTRILQQVSFRVSQGERIGLLGRNGAGKSTLMQSLAGVIPHLSGDRVEARDLTLGYFAQHQIDALDLAASPLLMLRRIDADAREQVLRDWLGRFGFSGDSVHASVQGYSGGEKARLAFALIVYRRPNLLLLDEPTNHLDLDMRDALASALAEYSGAVVLVSHDRHLLAATVDRLVLVDGGRVEDFDGDLSDYARWSEGRRQAGAAGGGKSDRATRRAERAPDSAPAAERQERAGKDRQKAQRAAAKELEKIEQELSKLQARREQLEQTLADPALYSGARAQDLPALTRQKSELDASLATLESRWLELTETLEGV
jgi:ATP-binding cassette, subfamily F, member 3